MSGHLRTCFAAFVLFAGLWTSPASSNAFADWFNVAPQAATPPASAATPPASAETECLLRPGKSTADGQRWVYRLDGHRKCWFLTAEGTATAKKPIHLRAAKHRGAAPEENETARHKKAVDARAEILRSAPAETSQQTPRSPGVKVVDATSVPATGAAALVPPAPIANLATDQLMPDDPTPRQVDVETLLAAAPAAGDAVAASVPPAPGAFSVPEAGDDGLGWTATWIGALLMALGLVSVLTSSWTLRRAALLHQLK
jgi:hypothetical protein